MRVRSRCPAAASPCPSAASRCPAAASPCPSAASRCPAAASPCPAGNRCPGAASPCPSAASPCPPREPLPRRGEPLPRRGEPLPQRGEPLPQRGEPLPRRGEPLPQRGEPVPQAGDALPRRTGRTRRAGRHRSPHRLTLPPDAPTLVVAVPGSASPASDEVSIEVAEAAAQSCQGAHVQVAYLEGTERRLDEALAVPANGPWPALAVVVPLLAGPHPRADAALQQAVSAAAGPVVLAEHLGPHPLLAEALHARLAQVGLARESRARGLSIITPANGVLVIADRGDDAVRAAGVAAVLLAGRLAAPVMHASIDDPQGIATSVARLRDAGASRVAIAPCLIGPESDPRELDAISGAIGALAAPPLGAHQAIGQLVSMRYGAALVGVRPADSTG